MNIKKARETVKILDNYTSELKLQCRRFNLELKNVDLDCILQIMLNDRELAIIERTIVKSTVKLHGLQIITTVDHRESVATNKVRVDVTEYSNVKHVCTVRNNDGEWV